MFLNINEVCESHHTLRNFSRNKPYISRIQCNALTPKPQY